MRQLVFGLVLLLWAIPCAARIITVDDDGPADFNNIQAAINDANNGDTVLVLAGTYTGEGNRDIDFNGLAITVRSTDPNDPNTVAATVIDCNGSEAAPHRGFYFHSHEGPNSVLSGLTIANGLADPGGGIYCYESSPRIATCIITDNAACEDFYTSSGSGGGMFCWYSMPTVVGCTFGGNTAGLGGGMYNVGGGPTLTDCTFRRNSACGGGGMLNEESNPIVTNCNFTGNRAEATAYAIGSGGGMYNEWSNAVITNCVFSDNTACEGGGAMRNIQCSPIVTNCSFVNNVAWYYYPEHYLGEGGAVYNGGASPLVASCTFKDNLAYAGGAVFNDGGEFWGQLGRSDTTNCVFAGNSADTAGGALANRDYDANVTNCTFIGNYACNGSAVACESPSWDYPSDIVLTHCILWDGADEVWNNDGSTIAIAYSDVQGGISAVYDPCVGLVWVEGNIEVDPCFVEAGKWVDANDPNIMVEPNDPNAVWIDGDYHLKSEGWRWDTKFSPPRWGYDYVTSRCIDAGNPGSTLDEELLSIPGDPCNVYGGNLRINMGAYGGTAEASMPPYDWALLSDITNDGIVNFVDFAHLADMYAGQDDELPADFDRDGDVDYADLHLLTEDWLKQTSWHE